MRITTRSVAKSTLVAIMTAFAALILGVTQSLTTAVTASLGLTAVQALIVPGTGTPNPASDYMDNARGHYLVPSDDCVGGCTNAAVPLITRPVLAHSVARVGWVRGREVERLGGRRPVESQRQIHRRSDRDARATTS